MKAKFKENLAYKTFALFAASREYRLWVEKRIGFNNEGEVRQIQDQVVLFINLKRG